MNPDVTRLKPTYTRPGPGTLNHLPRFLVTLRSSQKKSWKNWANLLSIRDIRLEVGNCSFFLFEIENPTDDDEDISPLLDTFIEVIFFIRALIQLHLNHTFAIWLFTYLFHIFLHLTIYIVKSNHSLKIETYFTFLRNKLYIFLIIWETSKTTLNTYRVAFFKSF